MVVPNTFLFTILLQMYEKKRQLCRNASYKLSIMILYYLKPIPIGYISIFPFNRLF